MPNEYAILHETSAARQGEMTISDLARIHSVSLRTLRFYEDRGMLHPRRQGTQRFYSVKDCIRLELILKGKRLGFTLAEIGDLIVQRGSTSQTDFDDTDLTVRLDHQQVSAQIAHLEKQRREIDQAIEELRVAHERMSGTPIGMKLPA